MTQVSRRKLKPKVEDKMNSLLYELLGKKRSRSEFQSSCNILFTQIEQQMMAKRIAVMFLILKGIDQKTISRHLKVSTATVSKFSLICTQNPHIAEQFDSTLQRESFHDLLEEIWMILSGSGTVGMDWAEGRKRQWEHERRKREGI